MSCLTQERKKNWVPTSYLQEEDKIRRWVFFVLRVAQIKKAKYFFTNELHTRASTEKPRKPLSPPGLVYRHKKGTWERKEIDQGRQEGGSSEGKVPCALHQEFLFFVHEYLGLEAARLGWSIRSYETWSMRKPCAKKVPKTDYFTQRKQYLKRTTLRTYSAKAVPQTDYFTQVEDPAAKHCSKDGPHYHLGAWARKLSSDKRQSTFIHELGILGDSYLGCTA